MVRRQRWSAEERREVMAAFAESIRPAEHTPTPRARVAIAAE